MSEPDVRAALSTFGCSEKAIDAYLAVVERGTATTAQVAGAADVSQSYVYEIADDLADRGLVTVDESSTPTQLRARSPSAAADALAADLSSFEDAVESVYDAEAAGPTAFEVVKAPRTVERRARRTIADARHEVFLYCSPAAFELLAEDLAAAVDRGVFVYVLLAAPDAAGVLEGLDPASHATVVRTWDATPPLTVLREATAGVMAPHDMVPGRGEADHAISFAQPEIGSAVHGNMVSNVWPMGEQRYVAEPPALPATFEHVRSAVTTAALHDTAGHDLVVDATARPVDGDEPREFAGAPLREVRQGQIDPRNVTFPVENALVLETDEGLTSLSGDPSRIGVFYEEFAAEDVTLRRAG